MCVAAHLLNSLFDTIIEWVEIKRLNIYSKVLSQECEISHNKAECNFTILATMCDQHFISVDCFCFLPKLTWPALHISHGRLSVTGPLFDTETK